MLEYCNSSDVTIPLIETSAKVCEADEGGMNVGKNPVSYSGCFRQTCHFLRGMYCFERLVLVAVFIVKPGSHVLVRHLE